MFIVKDMCKMWCLPVIWIEKMSDLTVFLSMESDDWCCILCKILDNKFLLFYLEQWIENQWSLICVVVQCHDYQWWFFDENDEIIVPGCTAVYLKALRQGYKDINIKATVTVAAYIPLKVSASWRTIVAYFGMCKHWSFLCKNVQTLDPEDIAVVSLG